MAAGKTNKPYCLQKRLSSKTTMHNYTKIRRVCLWKTNASGGNKVQIGYL